MARSVTVVIDDNVYKTFVDYKLKTRVPMRHVIQDALQEKAVKLRKELSKEK